MNPILDLFHHIHHEGKEHKVHHCGGDHKDIDYTIKHCHCGKHQIDKQEAIGHATANENLEPIEVKIAFIEICPEGGLACRKRPKDIN